MGYGQYSFEAHRAMTESRATQSKDAVFAETGCHPSMDPRGVRYRESRDSVAHPDSVGVVFALDVSGSMGTIPHQLATRTLPTFMQCVTEFLPDAQLLFLAFGNAYGDRSPLQVGQFESEAARIDTWLSRTHLEGAGGGLGESYDLAMYFAARHTSMDCLEKRGRKGYFFMTGDEPGFVGLDASVVRRILDDGLEANLPLDRVVEELLRSFHVFFLIPDHAHVPPEWHTEGSWRRMLHERVILLEAAEDMAVACAVLVGIQEGALSGDDAIRARLGVMGWTGDRGARVLRAVAPYAEALARGPIAGPLAPIARQDAPPLRG